MQTSRAVRDGWHMDGPFSLILVHYSWLFQFSEARLARSRERTGGRCDALDFRDLNVKGLKTPPRNSFNACGSHLQGFSQPLVPRAELPLEAPETRNLAMC